MDEFGTHVLLNPFDKANELSKTFQWWLNPFILRGFRKEITQPDIYNVPTEDSAEAIFDKFERFKARRKKPITNLLKLCWSLYGASFAFNIAMTVIASVAMFVMQVCMIGYVVRSARLEDEEGKTSKYLYTGGLVALNIITTVLIIRGLYVVDHTAIKIRVLNNALMYRKCLLLTQSSLSKISAGKILNFMSADAAAYEVFIRRAMLLFVHPLTAVLIIVIMWPYVSYSITFGVIFNIIVTGSMMALQNWQSRIRLKTCLATDERLRLTKDILTGIKVIKMYAWEKPFHQLINNARRKEVNYVSKTLLISAVDLGFQFAGQRIGTIITLFTIYLTRHTITTEAMFMLLLAFNRLFSVSITSGIRDLATVFVANKRIEGFLQIEEHSKCPENDSAVICNSNSDLQKGVVVISNISASWDLRSENKIFSRLSMNFPSGKFTVIIGEVGSCKTSLLMAILGELQLTEGNVELSGQITYAPQEPWVFSGSLRKNILLGQPFDNDRYSKIIEVSQLHQDLEEFEHGDKTLLGDNGVSVSGGQKARIGLARCLYREADIYIMDDPLSAVDAKVGQNIFKKCMIEYLANKTRILVTHQTHFINRTDNIIEMSKGKCRFSGSFDKLVRTSTRLLSLWEKKDRISKTMAMVDSKTKELQENVPKLAPARKYSDMNVKDIKNLKEKVKETKASGGVRAKYYFNYINLGGKFTFILLILTTILSQLFSTFFDCWMKVWSEENAAQKRLEYTYSEATALRPPLIMLHSNEDQNTSTNLPIVCAFAIGVVVFAILRTIFFVQFCKCVSMNLHVNMLNGILRSKMSFFDFNSTGRILNRFSKDLITCDELLPLMILDCLGRFLMTACVVVPVIIACYWLALLSLVVVIVLAVNALIYIKSSSELKRFDAIARGSTFQHVNATLDGLTTVRAMRLQKVFTTEYNLLQNMHTSVSFVSSQLGRWLGVVTDLPSTIYVSLLVVIMALIDSNASSLGLALSTGNQIVFNVQIFIRLAAEAMTQMTSVERVGQYIELESEAELETDADISSDWPTDGRIEFRNVSAQYSSSTLMSLKSVSCIIHPREKIGVVGRTGAGKSTFLSLLFRIMEPIGDILIDGENIRPLGLHNLRQKISIIPQDPILFAGTLRINVDPFDQYSDDEILQALTDVQLRSLVDANDKGLSAIVTSGGGNLSVGQRQLLCLARAILRDNKILVMDEATANVDRQTDELIQMTIRLRFKNCTVLTIAHRLNTIIDSDRIIVLENGVLVEFDAPHVLLQNKNGHFSNLVQQTGKDQFDLLTRIAQMSYINKV